VRSADGDAVAFLTDARFKSLATNDDADASTKDAHVTASLPSAGDYYLVFRERDEEPATFQVSLSTSGAIGVDAGPPAPPEPGTPCTTIDEIASRACGACGIQRTICLPSRTPGGPATWGEYAACADEKMDGCIPGTVEEVSCGNCGKLTQTCTPYCTWAKTACTGQPVNSCSPGSMDYLAACATPGDYRPRSCNDACAWSPSGACSAPATTIDVVPNVGGTTYTIATLAGAHARLSGMCPSGALSTLAAQLNVPFAYVQVKNPHPKAAIVTVYSSQASGSGIINTALASYARATAPATDAERKACDEGVATFGDASLTGNSAFASMHKTGSVDRRVTIPAGATYTIYVAAETNAPTNVGSVKLNVRTDEFL